MLLIVAMADLAERLTHILPNAQVVLNVDGDGTELRHRIHEFQPDVLLLDYRIGGSLWRAIDEVPAIISRTTSRPHVIALLPWTSEMVERAAADCGCFDAISVREEDFDLDVLEAVEAAFLDRYRQQPDRRRVSRADLH